ncbi:MAG: hypothetical protein IPJ77_15680 [Planctomycetes bacterium]|nr:hypothetical protein [Planctomycetota bacterium]
MELPNDRTGVRSPVAQRARSSRNVHVRVRSERGEAIEGARLFAPDLAADPMGTSDRAGDIELQLPEGDATAVVVAARGWRTVRVMLGPPLPAETTVVLGPEARLAGRVVWKGGEALSSPATVVAWPNGHAPGLDELERGLDGIPGSGVFVVLTDKGGTFELEGLDGAKSWTIMASTPGGLSRGGRLGRRAELGPVTVEVEHALAAIVSLRDPNLPGVATSEGVIGRGWAWYYDGDSEETVTQDALHPLSLYFGTPRVQWARLASSNTMHVLLFWSDVRRSELFPAVLEAELAGYAPIWTQVAAAPVGGLLPEYRIELTPTCTQRGSLELRFSGVSMDVRPESITKHLLGHLHMVSGNGRELTIAVEKPASAVHVFSGVPHGNYRAHFQVEDCGLRLPGGNESFAVQVGAQPAVLRVDLRGLESSGRRT